MFGISCSLSLFVTLLLPGIAQLQLQSDQYAVNDEVGVARRYDGIGGLSGGSATSKLLIGYPEKQMNEVLDYLFKPKFAASLQILKVEIGGDAQASDATEASHMHVEWEENYQRGYEWWLMKEAKKRNPNIKLYGLPWAFPGWLGKGTQNPYIDRQKLANYIFKWIQGAWIYHSLNIDYIGIWNERNCDTEYVTVLRKTLDDNGYSHVLIVASDLKYEIVDYIVKDSRLAAAVLREILDNNGFEDTQIVATDSWWSAITEVYKDASVTAAIDILGVHYPGVLSPDSAKFIGKQLWSSEDYSTFNDEVGGGCWARILNQNYVQGLMTSTIAWNLIDSFFQSLPWDRDSLMTAREPWSGNYIVESPIWMSAHTTQLTEIGWHYLPHGHGVGMLKHGGSYVALVSPDLTDLTIVIEAMSHDHSACIRPALPPYTVKQQNVTFVLSGSFASITELNIWRSTLKFDGTSSIYFQSLGVVKVVKGKVTVTVGVDQIISLTTLNDATHGEYPDPPPSAPFPLPYVEDFEEYALSAEPYMMAPQQGSYDVVDAGGTHGNVMRQMVLQTPVSWCEETLYWNASLNLVGRFNWTDVDISVDVKVGAVNGSNGVFVGVRIDNGGCSTYAARGIFFFIFPNDNLYLLTNDITLNNVAGCSPENGMRCVTSLQHGCDICNFRSDTSVFDGINSTKKGISIIVAGRESSAIVNDWNRITLSVKGHVATGTCNGILLFNVTIPISPPNGLVGVGTDVYGYADFDNIHISSATGPSTEVFSEKNSKGETLYFVKEKK